MTMNSAHAFSHAISGSFTDQQMQQNADYVSQQLGAAQQLGGWLAKQATNIMDGFNKFVESRAWEFSRRLDGNDGDRFLGHFEIGYLGSPDAILGAQGLMANYIMANPAHMKAFLAGEIKGYEGLSPLCKGVGAENMFYRKARHGVMEISVEDNVASSSHSHYMDMGNQILSFRDRSAIDCTWTAADHHRAKGLFDVKSEKGSKEM